MDGSTNIISSVDVDFRIGKAKTLDKVTMEQWGYANTKIMATLIGEGTLKDTSPYLKYTADIFRLASKHVWFSILLYDQEYREHQAIEGIQWGTYRQDIRDFNLVLKPNNPTTKAFQDAFAGRTNVNGRYPQQGAGNSRDRQSGPFMPNGQEICRNYNTDTCTRPDCKMNHCCSICLASSHSAVQRHSR